MSHFKYEINERNLRVQMKDNSVPYTDEAWQKFENYSASQKQHTHGSVMTQFNLSLNRNVVLPVVFGGVIVLFSLLLFNFVNIKNPALETADVKTEPTPASVAAAPAITKPKLQAASTPTITPVLINEDVAQVGQKSNTAISESPSITTLPETPVIRVQKRSYNPDTGSASETASTPPATSEQISAPAESQTIQGNVPTSTKKKRKRATIHRVETESTAEEDEQAPPPVTQSASAASDEIQ